MESHSSPAVALPSPSVEDGVLLSLSQATQREGLDVLTQKLMALRTWLHNDLAELEEALLGLDAKYAQSLQKGVRGAASHLLALPGKRIRPLCVMLASRFSTRARMQEVHAAAVACELVHAATLLHDDVIDDATERRGAPSSKMLYGNAASILAGDHLLVEALRRVHPLQPSSLLGSLLEVISTMVEAEAIQLERRGRFEPNQQVYLDVIQGKTAVLFRWGLQTGAVLAGLSEEQVQALGNVGTCLGMAFQLVDDVLDVEGQFTDTGKGALADVREGKLTWPLIIASERDASFKEELDRWARSGEQMSESSAHEVAMRVQSLGALEATKQFAVEKAEEACRYLQWLPECAAKTSLQVVVESAVHRAR